MMAGDRRPRVIGLTGSIGMGKSTVAGMFAELGIPVFDADAAVRSLYAAGGAAVDGISRRFPGVVREGVVDRKALAAIVFRDGEALADLESIVHPLVRRAESDFLASATARGARFVVIEIPLLFETGADDRVDTVVVVSAPSDVQRRRVLGRPGMTEPNLTAILARQMSDSEKRSRADFIINTGLSLEETSAQVAAVVSALGEGDGNGEGTDARSGA